MTVIRQKLVNIPNKEDRICSISHQRELLKFFANQLSENLDIDVGVNYITDEDIEKCLKDFNCD